MEQEAPEVVNQLPDQQVSLEMRIDGELIDLKQFLDEFEGSQ